MSNKKVTQYKDFDEVYRIGSKIATINLVLGEKVYGEEILKIGKKEYRIWDVYRSKPAAAMKKKLRKFPLKKSMTVLYLGAASGTTVSHFSDIVGENGIIYGVEISERVLRDLIHHAEVRGNIVPILADARKPEEYRDVIFGKVDLIYEDVASKEQIPILIRNSKEFLKDGGYAMIAIKSQSIDVTKDPRKVYKECLSELEKYFEIIDKVELDPYEKMHMFVVLKSIR